MTQTFGELNNVVVHSVHTRVVESSNLPLATTYFKDLWRFVHKSSFCFATLLRQKYFSLSFSLFPLYPFLYFNVCQRKQKRTLFSFSSFLVQGTTQAHMPARAVQSRLSVANCGTKIAEKRKFRFWGSRFFIVWG